ncbi:toxin glutamine deamidase domain-containing protein [Nonomuraea indica]|uniref:toxin glutamine deamidase domain-containing protein n=1 Tax=Nonomuraea indica TaxID=1581193 RepID=UPI001FE2FBA0|nr:toxin glutamine deamidase domain-containing protein [Nonomuraea indica]
MSAPELRVQAASGPELRVQGVPGPELRAQGVSGHEPRVEGVSGPERVQGVSGPEAHLRVPPGCEARPAHALPGRPPATPSWAAPPAAGEGSPAGATRTWFDLAHRPPRLAHCRPYGVPGGLARPDQQVERDLALAVPPGTRFPDPRGTWVRLVNGGGPADDPFRASNAADCALAVLSTWHGEPEAAAPRQPEYDRIGRPLLGGEAGGTARIERWIGQRFQFAGHGRHAYPMLARRLLDAGHGAAAVLLVRWPGGGTHAWNAVNSGGEVIWIDAQRGHMAVEPPYTTVTGVFCIIIDSEGRPR